MRNRYLWVVVFCLLSTAPYAVAQETVTSGEIFRHIIHFAGPEYPAIARAAHVQGTVVLHVRIGIDGKVASMQAISGPPMLIQAAKDSVQQWTLRAFEKNGSPVEVVGDVSVNFILQGERQTRPQKALSANPQPSVPIRVVHVKTLPVTPAGAIAVEFRTALKECVEKLNAQKGHVSTEKESTAAASVCRKAADITEHLAPDEHYIDERVAFIDAAVALKNNGDLVNALVYATKAVDVTNLGHDLDVGRSEAYLTRGSIEFYLGALSSADKDMSLSEDYERKAIVWAGKEAPINVPDYKKVLGQELRFHANVSLHLNHAEAAKKELSEASSL